MSNPSRLLSSPSMSASASLSTSSSSSGISLPSMSSVLTAAQGLAGVIPVVGTQLQSAFTLAVLLAKRFEALKDLQAAEQSLLTKIKETLIIIDMAIDDRRSWHKQAFRDELKNIHGALESVETYLQTRAIRRPSRQWRSFFSQSDTNNLMKCRQYLDSALEKLKLICSMQTKLEVDDLSARLTELERLFMERLDQIMLTVTTALSPPAYETYAVDDQSNEIYRGRALSVSRETGRRSLTPLHPGQTRSRSEFSDGEEAYPPKKRRTRRRTKKKGAATTRHLPFGDAGVASEVEYMSEDGGNVKAGSPAPMHVDEPGRGRGMGPSQRNRHRSNSRGRRGGHRHRETTNHGWIDENHHTNAPMLNADATPAINVLSVSPALRMAKAGSDSLVDDVGPSSSNSRPRNIMTVGLEHSSPVGSDSAQSSPCTHHFRSRSASPVRTPRAYALDEKRRRAIFIEDDMALDLLKEKKGRSNIRQEHTLNLPPSYSEKASNGEHVIVTPGGRERAMQGLLFALFPTGGECLR